MAPGSKLTYLYFPIAGIFDSRSLIELLAEYLLDGWVLSVVKPLIRKGTTDGLLIFLTRDEAQGMPPITGRKSVEILFEPVTMGNTVG